MFKNKLLISGIFLFFILFLSFFTVKATGNICEEAGGECRDFLDGKYKTPDDQCKSRIAYNYKYDASKPCIYCQTCPKRVCCIYDATIPSPLPTTKPTPTSTPFPKITHYSKTPIFFRPTIVIPTIHSQEYGIFGSKTGWGDQDIPKQNEIWKEISTDKSINTPMSTSVITECEAFYECRLDQNQTKENCLENILNGEAHRLNGSKTSCSKCFYGGFKNSMCCWDCR